MYGKYVLQLIELILINGAFYLDISKRPIKAADA
jgi:hypothetical protein